MKNQSKQPVRGERPKSASRSRRGGVRLTGRGWTMLALSVGLPVLGWWVREPAMVHMGMFGLGLLGLARWLAGLNVRSLTVERTVPRAVFVGREFVAESRLSNPHRWRPAWAVELADELLGPFGQGFQRAKIRPGEVVGDTFQTRLRQRGLNPVLRWSIRSSFPLGVWAVDRAGRAEVPVVVYPRPVVPAAIEDAIVADELESGEALWLPQPDWSGDYLGIRDFQPGDPMKAVHWRATARVGRLVVREFDRRLPEKAVIFFHSYRTVDEARFPDAFEGALELLAGLLERHAHQRRAIQLIADFEDWVPLAVADGADLTPALEKLAAARWMATADLAPLVRILEGLSDDSRAYIVSDCPVRLWEGLIPAVECRVICLSVADFRRRGASRRLERSRAGG